MDSKTICVLAWNHLATHPGGEVSLCCISDHRDAASMAKNSQSQLLNLTKNSLDEILNSEVFCNTRKQMLEGKRPPICEVCYRHEDAGLQSKRQYENAQYPKTLKQVKSRTDTSGAVSLDLEFLELRLGNLCNLKCRTCNPASSSKWTTDYEALSSELNYLTQYNCKNEGFSWPEKSEVWDGLLTASSKSLKTIYINGGEPMLSQKHFSFLQSLIEKGDAKKIELIYSINCTLLSPKALDLWPHFKKVVVKVSVDDLDKRNKYIRYPADWNAIEKNLQTLKKLPLELSLMQTVSAYNFYYLDEYWSWAQHLNLPVAYNYVNDPEYLGPKALPLPIRQKKIAQLKGHIASDKWNELHSLFSNTDYPELTNKFIEYTRSLDRLRKERFTEVFPELAAEFSQPECFEVSNASQ
ncbi:twitch domain-containing radical SAM protein [Pseudobdellovibrio exovorus]|uniref:Uncharacterized protein n=1 Tax=Pseudobdellovibrio exovorus JSS TaxID=1184267 RepID=M4VBI1_9BACT|nr:twitch domain-containing radical SAM protein [Pseudobdellovibrio exovorus]AGH96563.1 hypothetical protein A11Q_2347 [Pseudobdellovibrio exovorus JSS]